MKQVAAAMLLTLVTACSPSSAPSNRTPQSAPSGYLAAGDPVREEVLKELTEYYDHMSARDWKAYAEHFWPGATITTVFQPSGEPAPRVVITSIPDFVAKTAEGPDSKPIFEERMLEADVRAHNDLAQVWASYRARFGEPGRVDEWTGIDALTMMKHEGRRKIVGLAFSGT